MDERYDIVGGPIFYDMARTSTANSFILGLLGVALGLTSFSAISNIFYNGISTTTYTPSRFLLGVAFDKGSERFFARSVLTV